mmetsp:Transcript_20953/g.52933  ORF Transcript_20953/g.52933 Transcript_20953/m.52933 type:complete len:317 (+) Transcript_20953:262-1212(+)
MKMKSSSASSFLSSSAVCPGLTFPHQQSAFDYAATNSSCSSSSSSSAPRQRKAKRAHASRHTILRVRSDCRRPRRSRGSSKVLLSACSLLSVAFQQDLSWRSPTLHGALASMLINSVDLGSFPFCRCADCCLGELVPPEDVGEPEKTQCRFDESSETCKVADPLRPYCTPEPDLALQIGMTHKLTQPITVNEFCAQGCQPVPDRYGRFLTHAEKIGVDEVASAAATSSGTASDLEILEARGLDVEDGGREVLEQVVNDLNEGGFLPDTLCEKTTWLQRGFSSNYNPMLPDDGPPLFARFVRMLYNKTPNLYDTFLR